jgi:glycine cleavage system H protein
MSQIPAELRYAKSHEWVRVESDGHVTIGITYVQVPKVGATLKAGETFGVVESVKAASDLYAPLAGTVVAANAKLNNEPDTVNKAPYTDGWMIKLKPADPTAVNALLDAAGYSKLVG